MMRPSRAPPPRFSETGMPHNSRPRASPARCESLEPRTLLSAAAAAPSVDPVLEWNDVAIQALRADRARRGPTQAARSMAIVQTAVYDTVNAVTRGRAPILASVRAARRTRLDAAVASA